MRYYLITRGNHRNSACVRGYSNAKLLEAAIVGVINAGYVESTKALGEFDYYDKVTGYYSVIQGIVVPTVVTGIGVEGT